jgi:hypothetical protein
MQIDRLATRAGAMALAAIFVAGVAHAAEVTGVTVTPTELTIQEGAQGVYSVAVTSITGSIPARTPNAPALQYCSAWTIHANGTVTCDTRLTIPLESDRNYTQDPLTATEILSLTRTSTVSVATGTCGLGPFTLTDTLTLPSASGTEFSGGSSSLQRSVTVNVTCATVEFTGCGHGFWKTHPEAWVGYAPGAPLSSTFTMGETYADIASKTFAEALEFGGGNTIVEKAQLLLREAVAALLNAAEPSVNYEWTTLQIVSTVNSALASENAGQIETIKNTLDWFNNRPAVICQ